MYTDNISDNDDKKMMDGFCLVEAVTTKTIKNPQQLLTPMALDFPASAVTAILGPSGSGKTTVLSVITDNIQSNVTCRAQVHLPGVSAMVPQDDRLHGFYTVQSYLEHYARLAGLYAANAKDTVQEAASTKDAVQERIARLIQQLGLVDQSDTIVGDLFLKGLSGGQKRRLSIALEALSQPTNFFLDEPTSGLDAESALQVMEFLKEYARGAAGRRVILTIHQPSSFIWQTIDHVILLSKGQLMYNGGRVQCEDFFAAQGYPTLPGWNPADHYVTAVNDEFRNHALPVAEWATRFKEWKSSESADDAEDDAVNDSITAPVSSKHNSNHSHRLKERSNSILEAASKAEITTNRSRSGLQIVMELTRRYFLNLALNPGILGTRIAMYSMLALMVGALFWNLGERNDFEVCLYKTSGSCVGIAYSNVCESIVSRLYTSNHRFYVSCPAVDSIACRNCLLLCRLFHFHERRRLALYRHGARHCRQGSQQQVLPSHPVPNFPRHLQHSRCCATGLFGITPHYYNAQTQRPSLVFPQYVLGSSRRRSIGAARFPRGSAFHHWYGLARGNVWLFYALSRIHARAIGIPELAAMGL
jgi:ABC-type multidrug transport system ATPase subunit